MRRDIPDLGRIPGWVRNFFNPRTLGDAIRFADECIQRRQYFLMACFLGILHHQRPGFLSYPSSHLVPYLRDNSFPKEVYPELYQYRDLMPRMSAKIDRAFKISQPRPRTDRATVLRTDIGSLSIAASVDAIITSPPYMNALDYQRDNRLRLWFLDRSTCDYSPEPTDRKAGLALLVGELVRKARVSLRKGGRLVLVVGETVVRKRVRSHPSVVYSAALEATNQFVLIDAIRDSIPDIRRSRREYSATKAEHILVYEKIR